MNFALLGDDPAVLAAGSGHRAASRSITVECGDASSVRIDRRIVSLRSGSADSADLGPDPDRERRRRGDCLRRRTGDAGGCQANRRRGKTAVIVPQASQGSTWIYELGLIRDEGHVSLVPVFVDRLRPTLHILREAIDSGALGRLLYLQIDREVVPEESHGGAGPADEESSRRFAAARR